MRENGMFSRQKQKFRATTNSKHNFPVAPNLLKKGFQAKTRNKKWVGDITYIPTDEGWLYIAAIEDLFTRKIVGWTMDSRMTKQLTLDAIEQGLKRERPSEGLIIHSDRCPMPIRISAKHRVSDKAWGQKGIVMIMPAWNHPWGPL